MTTNVNSKVLGILDPHQVSSVMKSSRTFAGGYPVPGPQSLTVTSAMNKNCFVDENTWRLIAENGDFDDIVVGSGFCALGYIDEALRLNPFRKILLLERGGFWLPDHFQNLPLPFQFVQQNVSETFPWALTSETNKAKISLSGSSPFFGGRSAFWSIWSPRAIELNAEPNTDGDLMDDFPRFMKDIARSPDFCEGVDRLLNIKSADAINDSVFLQRAQDGTRIDLQTRFQEHLTGGFDDIAGALSATPARLATGVPIGRPTTGFRQFSTIGSLLSINERQNKLATQNPPAGKPFMIATEVVVERFELDPANGPTHARVLHTSRGPLTLRGGKTNVILATGAIPATTILLNSISDIGDRAGKRLTSHFRSQIKARFKLTPAWLGLIGEVNLPEILPNPLISASHVRGRTAVHDANNSNLQWHIQVQGSYIPENYQGSDLTAEESAQRSSRLFTGLAPDNEDMLTPEELKTSEGYVIISCSTLGEHPKDTASKVELNKSDPDVTTNVRLHLDLPENSAKELWKKIGQSSVEAIRVIAATEVDELEYWNREDLKWERLTGSPSKKHINPVKALFHEASTTFMTENFEPVTAENIHASVDKSYRPFGLAKGNVYVTGAGLFPTAGSWNPTPTIVGFAQHLAKKLVIPKSNVGVITQDQLVPATRTLGRPYIIGFKGGNVSFWNVSSNVSFHPRTGAPPYRKDRHIRLLADTTGNGFYDLVAFTDTNVSIAARNSDANTFTAFVDKLQEFTYNSGWSVDKNIRYMADVRKTGRADIIGFGDVGVFLSENEPAGVFKEPSIVLDDLCYDKGWRLDKHLRLLADFYGNGFPDIIGFGETSIVVAKNNGNGTFEAPYDLGLDKFTFESGWRVNKHVRTVANITSKDRVDIIGFYDDGVYVAINKGDGTVRKAKRVLEFFGYDNFVKWRVEEHLRFVADINGDGLHDIVGFGPEGVYVSKNTGKGTFEQTKIVSRDFGYDKGWRVGKHPRFMVDITGDGCADIVGFKDKVAYVAFNDGEGNFGHAQPLTDKFGEGWDPSTSVRYVTRLN